MQSRRILMRNKVNLFKELDQRTINAYHNIAYRRKLKEIFTKPQGRTMGLKMKWYFPHSCTDYKDIPVTLISKLIQ